MASLAVDHCSLITIITVAKVEDVTYMYDHCLRYHHDFARFYQLLDSNLFTHRDICCRGYKSDSRSVGYERMGRALATARMYEFRPLYGGGKSLTSQCSWELCVECIKGLQQVPTPVSVVKGGLYRVRCPS